MLYIEEADTELSIGFAFSLFSTFFQRYLTAIRTYFTRWLIRKNLYDLTRTI